MRTLAIANQKGGTGKTTTALNLGAGLAAAGYRCLLIDCDPQSSLTRALLPDYRGPNLADAIGGARPGRLTLADIIQPTAAGPDLAPSGLELAGSELLLAQRMARETVLRKVLTTAKGYDCALLDCAPSLGLLVVNALTAADGVLIPARPDPLDLRGVQLFLSSLADIRQELAPDLQTLGVVLCQADRRSRMHAEAAAQVRAMGLEVLATVSRSVQASRTMAAGAPITTGRLSDEYTQLASEVIRWLKT